MARDNAPSWELDELAHAGQEHLDAFYVASYDEKSPTDWSDDVRTLLALGIGSSSTVVDFGAGPDRLRRQSRHVRRVVGVDVSPAMVAALQQRGIEAVQAGFLTYRHSGDPPDAVTTRNALHHLPDFWKVVALSRIAAMLRPGGALLLRDLVFSFDPLTWLRRSRRGLTQLRPIPPRVDRRAARRSRPHRALDVHVAARPDARHRRLRDQAALPQRRRHPRRLCLHPPLTRYDVRRGRRGARSWRGYVERARSVATASAVSNSFGVIRTTPVSKSALAFSDVSICDSTAFIGTGGSHSST